MSKDKELLLTTSHLDMDWGLLRSWRGDGKRFFVDEFSSSKSFQVNLLSMICKVSLISFFKESSLIHTSPPSKELFHFWRTCLASWRLTNLFCSILFCFPPFVSFCLSSRLIQRCSMFLPLVHLSCCTLYFKTEVNSQEIVREISKNHRIPEPMLTANVKRKKLKSV